MSFLQDLKGITVLPSPALRRSNLFRKNPNLWPRGFAFGGWIYDANVTLGFSKQPTEITLSLVLENDSSFNPNKEFDIHDDLLSNSLITTSQHYGGSSSSAYNFRHEFYKGHFYTIDLHGIRFNRMYLFDYSISIEATQKTLAVTFKDYSIILDKIYVGLMQRQGPHRHPGERACDPNGHSMKHVRTSTAKAFLKALCPNCYLTGDGFYRGNKNPILTKGYGGNLSGFFTPMEGTIYREADLGSYMGRVHPGNTNRYIFRDNLIRSGTGGTVSRFSPQEFWHNLALRVDSLIPISRGPNPVGFTMDGGFMMLGTEEFEERTCGNAPQISYNFSELLNSMRNRGIPIYNTNGSEGNLGNSFWPDRNPRFRANYIGTLREVLEQWCGIYSLDFYYKDRDNLRAGVYFLDLKRGADIGPIRDVVDPSTAIGREFGATDSQSSVIVSYKESSTLDNTYIQRVITSNVKPFMVKERKKSVKRYIPILPLHPLDFATPSHRKANWKSLLGEIYENPVYANYFPWTRNPQDAPDTEDHRKRLFSRTGRELWDVDVSIALSRLGQEYRDLYISNRICEVALSEIAPVKNYPKGHKREGQAVQHIQNPDGSPGAEATEIQMKKGIKTCARRINQPVPKNNNWRPNMTEEKDFDCQMDALGFEQLVEVEDFAIKENLVEMFLSKQEVEDISMDIGNYKMFIGYYDEDTHKQHVAWEQKCAEAMYGFGAVMGGTIPAYPFIPRDYYGIMDGQAGFSKCGEGLSIPKLLNNFEPGCAQYPIYSLEQAQRTKQQTKSASIEALNAPFNSILIESGNYLPTGLYIAQLDNPWGKTVEHFQKRFWEAFQDNACKEFNDSLNMIQTAGFNKEPAHDPPQKGADGKLITKKASDMFPFKKQDWNLGMFTPKFFKNTDQIFDAADGMIQSLYDAGRLVDEVSMNRRSADYGHQRFCKKISVMIITDTRLVDDGHGNWRAKHPNISFDARPLHYGKANYMARHQRELWEIAEYKRHQKDDIRNRCDYDLLFEFCEDAIQKDTHGTYANRGGWGQLDKAACAVDPTGVYKEGFPKELVGGYPLPGNTAAGLGTPKHRGRRNSRVLRMTITRNPDNPVFLPTSELGFYHIQDLEEDLDVLKEKSLTYDIVYPINNWALTNENGSMIRQDSSAKMNPAISAQFYSGIWTADVTIEDRRPELIEIYGRPPAASNPTAGVRIVNNTIDPDLDALMDPNGEFVTQMYDNEGNQVTSIDQFHNYIAHGDVLGRGANGLDHYSVISPTKKIELSLAGSLMHFPNFANTYCDPVYGLQNLSISLSDGGARTSMSFADRPPKAPAMEGILNKIGPRTM